MNGSSGGKANTISGRGPFFRAVNVDGQRRALRLERGYWDVLESIAKEEGCSLGDVLARIVPAEYDTNNQASAVRQFVLEWVYSELQHLRGGLSEATAMRLVTANPSPAFILTSDRMLRHYNEAFLRYVRTGLPQTAATDLVGELRLQIDMSIQKLLEELRQSQSGLVQLGFVIGASERRVRGRMTAALFPAWPKELIVGFVSE